MNNILHDNNKVKITKKVNFYVKIDLEKRKFIVKKIIQKEVKKKK